MPLNASARPISSFWGEGGLAVVSQGLTDVGSTETRHANCSKRDRAKLNRRTLHTGGKCSQHATNESDMPPESRQSNPPDASTKEDSFHTRHFRRVLSPLTYSSRSHGGI